MKTDQLIDQLVRDLRPVAALRPPWMRAAGWLLGAIGYMGLVTVVLTSREDLEANGTSWGFVAPQVSALVMAATAAVAAFETTIPGAARRMLLPAGAAAALWVASLLPDAVHEWSQPAAVTLAVKEEWLCVALAVLGGALPAGAMTVMLRRGALLSPALTAALGAVAVAALANIAACLSHPHPSSAVTLVWHAGTIGALAALAASGGRRVLAKQGEPAGR